MTSSRHSLSVEYSCFCVAMLDDHLSVIHLKFRPYPSSSDVSAAQGGGAAGGAETHSGRSSAAAARRSPVDSPRSSRSLERNVSLNPIACMEQGRCGAGTASVQGRLLAVGRSRLMFECVTCIRYGMQCTGLSIDFIRRVCFVSRR